MEETEWGFAIALGGYVLGLLSRTIAPVIIDRFQLYLVRKVAAAGWRVGKQSQLGGKWNHVWYAAGSSAWPDENRCAVTLSVVGRHVGGVYVYQKRTWFVYGELHADSVITGTWGEIGRGYRGTWIGKVDLNSKIITGWYLGTANRPPGVGVGEWIWWRQGESEPSLPSYIVQIAERKT